MVVAVVLPSTKTGGKKAKILGSVIKANITFGSGDFDVPKIAIALLIVGVIIGLSGLILSIFASATASAISNPAPGSLAYNLSHPLVNGMVSFFSFFPTLYVLLGVTGIVLIAAGIISIIMDKFKT